jgi:putative tryptophan/tyrosine transport system substrate-binding protein
MKRRQFISLLGSAAALPLAARAEQPTMPVIGFLNAASVQDHARPLAAFISGLNETGYMNGQNVHIEYRWADGQNDRLPAMAADLVQRDVAVIAATTTPAALAAKAATTTIPIVFEIGEDPIKLGLVASLNQPGGNATGVTQLNAEVVPKRLELLHELLPAASVMAVLVNPADPVLAESSSRALLSAAHPLGLELKVLNASTERDFDKVFANVIQLRAGGLVICADAFLNGHAEQLGALTIRNLVPAIFETREFVAGGGLASYGGNIQDSYHMAGIYTGRVLKGDKPADLPVQEATKVELILNLKTAKALGITVPLALSGRADEVIE